MEIVVQDVLYRGFFGPVEAGGAREISWAVRQSLEVAPELGCPAEVSQVEERGPGTCTHTLTSY